MRPWLHALILASAALAVRLAAAEMAFRADRGRLLPDEARYLAASRDLDALDAEWRKPSGFSLPPAYPVLLAVEQGVSGDPRWLRFCGALLGALSCLVLVPLGRRTCGIGWPVGWAAALSPLCAASSAWLLSESLYVPLLVLALWGLARGTPGGALAAGGVLVLAHLTRPLALPFAVLAAVWLGLAGSRRLAWSLVLGGWCAFLILGFSAGLRPAVRMLLPLDRIRHTLDLAWHPEGRPYLSGRGDEGTGEAGASLAFRRAVALWRLAPRTTQLRGWPSRLSAAAWILTVPAALFGTWLALKDWRRTGWLPLLLFYTTAVHMTMFTSLRYRLPLEPFLVVLAVWGWSRLRTRSAPA